MHQIPIKNIYSNDNSIDRKIILSITVFHRTSQEGHNFRILLTIRNSIFLLSFVVSIYNVRTNFGVMSSNRLTRVQIYDVHLGSVDSATGGHLMTDVPTGVNVLLHHLKFFRWCVIPIENEIYFQSGANWNLFLNIV